MESKNTKLIKTPPMQGLAESVVIRENLIDTFIFDNISSGVFFLDNNFVLRKFNRTYADLIDRYTPFTPEQARGMAYFKYVPGSRSQLEPVFKKVRDSKQAKNLYDFELGIEGAGHDLITHWNVSMVPVVNSSKNMEGLLIFAQDLTKRRLVEDALQNSEQKLTTCSRKIEELESTLRYLLKFREEDRNELEEQVYSNVKVLVIPYLEKLKTSRLAADQKAYMDIIESNLTKIISPFSRRISSKLFNFTPKEIQIASLIKEGKSSKEIAELLNLSKASIDTHRNNIRKKLGLSKIKANLSSYLLSFS
jgi:DNA-binding CsgD family transcriptional regulator